MNYGEYRAIQPEMKECFFAFNKEQFEKGVERYSLKDKKIYNAGHGLYGTKEGIEDFLGQYEKIDEEIKANCKPQGVYDYEFRNHECSYTCDDEEAIKIVIGIFGFELAKSVKRRYNYVKIEELENEKV